MARFLVVFTICATAVYMGSVDAMSGLDYGAKMATKSMQGACWYEYLKRLPESPEKRSDQFGNCYANTDMDEIKRQLAAQNVKGDKMKPYYIQYIAERSDQFLPKSSGYSDCSPLTKEPEKEPKQDYSAILNDGDKPYPFRAFAHCLVGKLKSTYGQEAIAAMEQKWTKGQHWQTILNERENENRARHGAGKLKPNKELHTRAQRWADNLAMKCADQLTLADHINDKHPDYKYKNKPSGESIAERSSKATKEDNALGAANAWYEEVRSYPWPAYTGNGRDSQFLDIGHFTAQVWKGSEQVGYGLGQREGCDKVYIVARYWPGGNQVGDGAKDAFKNNIGAFQQS